MKLHDLAVVIPIRKGDDPRDTLESLSKQDFFDKTGFHFDIICSFQKDPASSVSKVRNDGFAITDHEYVLFSDADILWRPDALSRMYITLQMYPAASYSYGAYEMGGKTQCNVPFSTEKLRVTNFVSTMSMIRSKDFPGWDEDLYRLVDWALWLKMLDRGCIGAYVGEGLLFTTEVRDGITQNGPVSWQEARDAVVRKYGL